MRQGRLACDLKGKGPGRDKKAGAPRGLHGPSPEGWGHLSCVLQGGTGPGEQCSGEGGMGCGWRLGARAPGLSQGTAFGFGCKGHEKPLAGSSWCSGGGWWDILMAHPGPSCSWLLASSSVGWKGWGSRRWPAPAA